jgi:hypothetical protein
MGFNFPHPPDHTTFPQTAQTVANLVMGALALACLGYSLLEWRRGRGPLALVLLAGGAISYLNEPFLDVLGLVWHPRPGQDVALTTFGPVPVWGLCVYSVFFGTGTYLLHRGLARGLTRRRFWASAGLFFVVNLAMELPLLGAGLYFYYGYATPPMTVGGLPLYWLFINAGAPLVAACVLRAWPRRFAGWAVLRAALLPVTAYTGYCMVCGWPIFTALHTPSLPQALVWGAALMTVGIGATAFDGMARWIEATGAGDARAPTAGVQDCPEAADYASSASPSCPSGRPPDPRAPGRVGGRW